MAIRPSWNHTFLEIARVLSLRSTCSKKAVGCVIIDEQGRILATGYNGAPKHYKHCTDNLCPAYVDDTISCNAIHAEMNALIFCTDINKIHGVYITEEPCNKCLMLIQNTNAKWIQTPNERINLI